MAQRDEPNNPRKKRTPAERELDLALIARLYLQGKTQLEIAEHLTEIRDYSLSQQQIAYDLAKIVEDWRKQRFDDIDELKGEEIARLNKVEAEAWAAWFRSCEKKVESTAALESPNFDPNAFGDYDPESADSDFEITPEGGIKPTGNAGKRVLRESRKVILRDGNPAFLELVKSCIESRCKILGIAAPKNITLKTEYVVGIED